MNKNIIIENTKYIANNVQVLFSYENIEPNTGSLIRNAKVKYEIYLEEWLSFNTIKWKNVVKFNIGDIPQEYTIYGVGNMFALNNDFIFQLSGSGTYEQRIVDDLFIEIKGRYSVFQKLNVKFNEYNGNMKVLSLEESGLTNAISINGKEIPNSNLPYTGTSRFFVAKKK